MKFFGLGPKALSRCSVRRITNFPSCIIQLVEFLDAIFILTAVLDFANTRFDQLADGVDEKVVTGGFVFAEAKILYFSSKRSVVENVWEVLGA